MVKVTATGKKRGGFLRGKGGELGYMIIIEGIYFSFLSFRSILVTRKIKVKDKIDKERKVLAFFTAVENCLILLKFLLLDHI